MRLRDLVLSVAFVLALSPSLAHAQSALGKEHAKKLFDEGVELEKKTDYATALQKYKEAEAIAVTAGLRFHKGYCLEMLGKLVAAVDEYESAEKMARDQNKTDVRAATVARLEPLRGRVPQMSIRFTSPIRDGEVQVDGAAVGAPLLDGKGFRIDPGDHVVTARAPGYKPWKREVHVVEAITTTVDISLDRDAASPPPAAGVVPAPPASNASPASSGTLTEPPREADRSRSIVAPVVTTAGAVTLLVTGVVFFAVAGGAKSDAEKECPLKVECDSEQSKVRTFDTLALGSFIGAAGLGVLSVVLWTKSGSSSAAAARPPSTRLVARPGGAGIVGEF